MNQRRGSDGVENATIEISAEQSAPAPDKLLSGAWEVK
jgi:hypothetical protein